MLFGHRLIFTWWMAVAAFGSIASTSRATAGPASCRMNLVAEIKVKPGLRPTFETRIDGRPVKAIIDTGASSSVLTYSAARRLGLRPAELPGEATGIVGKRAMSYAKLDSIELGGGTFRGFQLMVIDSPIDIDLQIGRDFLTPSDLEFDLAHGVVRLLQPHGCQSDQMVYWSEKAYSQAALQRFNNADAFGVKVKLNGVGIDAIIDSGAHLSTVSLAAAAHAHVPLTAAPGEMSGIGAGVLERRVGTAALTIGDETVKSAHLEFADLFRGTGFASRGSLIEARADDQPDMLIGADFLMSHHVLISPSQRLVYFTYEGGPPFGPRPAPAAPAPK